jgi:hypothetical protein
MKKITLFILAEAVLSGCSATSLLSPAMQADLVRPIYCEGASECKALWKRAFQGACSGVLVATNTRPKRPTTPSPLSHCRWDNA